MATYSSVNGKAPSGLSVGDKVVTNGGTYTITGVNANGSYTSTKTSDTTKSTYTGSYATAPSSSSSSSSSKSSNSSSSSSSSYSGGSSSSGSSSTKGSGATAGISATTSAQQAIVDQMTANSQAWWSASSKAEKDALHAQNVALAQQLENMGLSTSYNGSTGTWSGTSSVPAYQQAQQQVAASTYTPTDNSEYLRQMAAAYLKQQQEALTAAYNENLSNLQAEQDKLGVQYTATRNAESANDALARQRWNETAAAYGLNSGTQGQAQLAFSTQQLANLSQIQQAEAAANAEVERQRTLLGQQYQSAMVEALAANNAQLFQQLYNEATRIDQALQNQQQFDASLAMQQYQTALDQYNTDRSFDYTKQLNEWQQQYQQQQDASDTALQSAKLLAAAGDYSAYGKIYGWDDDTVNRMNQLWAAQQAAASSSSRSSGGSSGSSRSTGNSSLADDALDWAAKTGGSAEDYVSLHYKEYGYSNLTQAKAALSSFVSETSSASGMSESDFYRLMQMVGQNLAYGGTDAQNSALSMMYSYWGQMSVEQQNQARQLLSKYQ